MDWLRERMAGEGKISPRDLDLVFLTDDPAEACGHIVKRLERRREILRGRKRADWGPEL